MKKIFCDFCGHEIEPTPVKGGKPVLANWMKLLIEGARKKDLWANENFDACIDCTNKIINYLNTILPKEKRIPYYATITKL